MTGSDFIYLFISGTVLNLLPLYLQVAKLTAPEPGTTGVRRTPGTGPRVPNGAPGR